MAEGAGGVGGGGEVVGGVGGVVLGQMLDGCVEMSYAFVFVALSLSLTHTHTILTYIPQKHACAELA